MARTEFDRIARLAECFGAPPPPHVGIGDDAAVIHPAGPVVATVDAAVEGVHFRLDLAPLEAVSGRAVEAAASDVAAMGGSLDDAGCGLLLAWTLPPWVDDDDLDALARGARGAADRLGTFILGGNLTAGPALTLTTTVLGRAGTRVLSRHGARPGDAVAVSGAVGAAALGLRALLTGRGGEPAFAHFVERWRSPHARLDAGAAAVMFATAAIDLSDGLAQDAGHVARASRCAIVLDASVLPMLPDQRERAEALGGDAVELALTGGEDYELLVTGPEGSFGPEWKVIGRVMEGSGEVRIEGAGDVGGGSGWDHFRAV